MLRLLTASFVMLAGVPAAAQGIVQGPPQVRILEEWVLVLRPALPTAPVTIAPQRFASEADCKALAAQITGTTTQCLKARLIAHARTDQ